MCALVFYFRSFEDVLCAAGHVLVDVPGLVFVLLLVAADIIMVKDVVWRFVGEEGSSVGLKNIIIVLILILPCASLIICYNYYYFRLIVCSACSDSEYQEEPVADNTSSSLSLLQSIWDYLCNI